jgi:hypothetical protein
MSETYSFVVGIRITVNGPMTGRELFTIKDGLAAQLNYLVDSGDFIQDYVQDHTASSVEKLEIIPAFLPPP